jgi:hypothetical protein
LDFSLLYDFAMRISVKETVLVSLRKEAGFMIFYTCFGLLFVLLQIVNNL